MADLNVRVIIDAIDNASKKFDGVAKTMGNVGSSLVKLGAAPTAALVLSTKAAIDYESAFAGIRKTVDATEPEFQQLSENIRKISKEAPVSANDLSKIGEMAGQLGVRGVDNLTKFIETISKMGVTTNLTGEEAATAFARIANIMQEPIENVDKMGSVVVELGNNFATTERDIVEFANRIAGAGKIAGLQTQNILAIGAAMSSVGVEAEAGGTAVQKVLLSMQQASVQGGKDLTTFAMTAGMSAQEFKAAWEEDAMAAFTQFVEGLGKQGDDAINTLSELGLEDQRLIRSFLSLANAGELLNDTYNKSAKAWMENIALSEEAEKRYKTTASQIGIIKNNLYDMAITLGDAVLPQLTKLMEALKPAIETFANFAKEHPQIVIGFLAVGAAIGVIGVALTAISLILPGLALLFSPVTLAVLAVGAALTIFYFWFKKSLEDAKQGIEVWKQIGIAIGEGLGNAVDWVKLKFQEFVMFIESLPERFTIFVENLKAGIAKFFLEDLPFAIGFAVGRFERMITEDIPNFVENAIKWFLNLDDRAKAAFEDMANKASAALTRLKDWAIAKAVEIYENVKSWFEKTVADVKTTVDNLPGMILEAFNRAKDNAINAAKSLYEGVLGWMEKVKNLFQDIINKAGDAISKATEAFRIGRETGQRQFGGPVSSSSPVLVGEKGPELFVPSTAGQIIPNNQLRGGGGGPTIQFIINADLIINSPTERRNLAEALYRDLVTLARSQNTTVAKLFGEEM